MLFCLVSHRVTSNIPSEQTHKVQNTLFAFLVSHQQGMVYQRCNNEDIFAVCVHVCCRKICLALTYFPCITRCYILRINNKQSLEQGIPQKSHVENAFCFLPQQCSLDNSCKQEEEKCPIVRTLLRRTHTQADVALRQLIDNRISLSSPSLHGQQMGKLLNHLCICEQHSVHIHQRSCGLLWQTGAQGKKSNKKFKKSTNPTREISYIPQSDLAAT